MSSSGGFEENRKVAKASSCEASYTTSIPSDASQSKKTRGGQRLRKNRERYAMTDMRNLANKIHFGVPEESSLDGGLGAADYGMLLFLIPRVWIFFILITLMMVYSCILFRVLFTSTCIYLFAGRRKPNGWWCFNRNWSVLNLNIYNVLLSSFQSLLNLWLKT